MIQLAPTNEETYEAWNGPLFDRFVTFRHLLTEGLGIHGAEALRLHPPGPGGRVLDIGCGFGDTAQQMAGIVGPEGSVLGVDVSERFVETSREEAELARVENVSFEVADVQVTKFAREFDFAYSRMGTMFFASPVPALRNVREALVPGGRLCMVVWRDKESNDWVHRAELLVEGFVEHPDPEDTDEPTCGPGPFSMANANTTSDILIAAGFEDVTLRRCDAPITIGRNLDEAIAMVTAIGPAGEVMRLAGDKAEQVRPQVEAALRKGLAEFVNDDGSVTAPASTWIVTATTPS